MEIVYKNIIDNYLEKNSTVYEFKNQWRNDRDNNNQLDERLQRLFDRLFTTCDCYSERPENSIEVAETKLRNEVALLRHIWYG